MPRKPPEVTKAPPIQLRAAVYCRKSTTIGLEQAFNSLDAQKEACEAYIARQHGWTLVPTKYHDGGYSGSNTDRPAFQRLMKDVQQGKVDVVVVHRVDRLSRSLLDFVSLLDTFTKTNTAFVSITQNFSTADAMGRLTLNMLMSFAEFEREMICERTRDKVRAARVKGQWTGGVVPIGYRVENKKLVVIESEAATVREAYTTYLNDGSVLSVMRWLNGRGKLTKHHVSALGAVRDAHLWTKSDVLHMLKNPLYVGKVRSRGELFQGEHAAIIDQYTWDKVQERLASKTPVICSIREDGSPKPMDYLLLGLLKCPVCAYAYTTATVVRRGVRHRYYRAVSQLKRGGAACICGNVPAKVLEEQVLRQIKQSCAEGGLARQVLLASKERLVARRRQLELELRDLPMAVKAAEQELARVERLMATAKPKAKMELDNQRLRAERDVRELSEKLEYGQKELGDLEGMRLDADWVATVIANFDGVWEVLTPVNRVRLVRALVKTATYDKSTGRLIVEMNQITRATGRPRQDREVAA